jgi:NADPH:quinone reductase-like Zn-dependent oxidoreductase
VVTHRREQVGERLGVVAREGLEEQVADELGVAGEHLGQQRAPGVRDRDRDASLVVWGGGAPDQARLLEQACLVGQATAAIDHAVRQVGHAVAAGRGVAETGQELKLHVAEAAGLAQLLLDGVSKQADHLDQGEVGAELNRVEGRWRVGHGRILLASNSKRCYGLGRCFKFEATSTPEKRPKMKAVRFHEFGDSDVLRYEDVEQPTPGAGEARIRVAATSFNPVDDGIRGGYLQGPFPVALPHTPGIDVAGTVDALGDGVTNVAVGDNVVAFLPMVPDGAAAEYVIAPAEILAPAPTSIPLPDAAALPMVGLTAWQALFDDAGLTAGQRVLINGAGGAVGGYAVQLATRTGAHVIATASPRSSDRVKSAGADEVIDHTTTEVTVAEPVDVLLNLAPITPEKLAALAALVRPGGVVVNTVPTIPTPADEERGVRGVGVFVRSDAEQLSRLVELVDRGELHVEVAQRVALAELPEVHAHSATLPGKVVVLPPAA